MQKLLTEHGIRRIYMVFTVLLSLSLNVIFYPNYDAFGMFINNFYIHYIGLSTYMAFLLIDKRHKENLGEGFFYKAWLLMQIGFPALSLVTVKAMHEVDELVFLYMLHGWSILVAIMAPLVIHCSRTKEEPKEEKPADKPAAEAPKVQKFAFEVSSAVMADFEAVAMYHNIDVPQAAVLIHHNAMWVLRNINSETKIAVIDRKTGEIIEEKDHYS